jgi:galactokinase
LIETVRALFRERYGREPSVSLAPGRVNLIGEHTDYNDGFVLPVAIDRYCALAFSPNRDGLLRGYSLVERDERAVPLDAIARTNSWLDYAAGVVWAYGADGVALPGMDFVVGGDVPIGAGLSSSAAFELATARALMDITSASWDAARAARIAQRAENDFVAVPCGIMDQMAASVSTEGCAMLLDCRDLSFKVVPIPSDLLVVVLDTGTRRSVGESAYRDRRSLCVEAAAALGVPALRDATVEMLERLPDPLRRRALHVVEENRRTLDLVEALRHGDERRIRALMKGSHESLRDLYEVSTPALDRMVEIASRHPAAVGARMTGAGFGGCAVALVRAPAVDDFARDVEASYREATGNAGTLYSCRAVSGVRIVGRG